MQTGSIVHFALSRYFQQKSITHNQKYRVLFVCVCVRACVCVCVLLLLLLLFSFFYDPILMSCHFYTNEDIDHNYH